MKRMLSYLKKYPGQSLLAPLFKLLEAVFDLLVPWVLIYLLNGVETNDRQIVVKGFIQLMVMAFIGMLCCLIAQYFSAKVATSVSASLRKDLFAHVSMLDDAQLDQLGSSTLISRLTSDSTLVQNGINMFLRLFLRSPFIVFGALLMAWRINHSVSLVFVGLIIILFVIVIGLMKLTNPLYKTSQNNLDHLLTLIRQNLSGVRVIRSFNHQQDEIEQFQKSENQLVQTREKADKTAALLNPLTNVMVNLAMIALLYYSGVLARYGLLQSASVIALVNYLSQILTELVKLTNLVVTIAKGNVSLQRIEQILHLQPQMIYGAEELPLANEFALSFDDVSFAYNKTAENSLNHISFKCTVGEWLSIIGPTGCGKSTIAALSARFYDCDEGKISLFGNDIRSYSKQQLHSLIAVVPQKAQLLSGTIRFNLVMGQDNITDDEIWAALKIAQADEFVSAKGLDSPVEQDGRNFSGGQKQRLCIARALLSKTKILILDDSSSALDYLTDAALRKGLHSLKDLTVIQIGQRTSSLSEAKQILVLEEGCMIALDSHEKLLENCPLYREIHESQQKEADDE